MPGGTVNAPWFGAKAERIETALPHVKGLLAPCRLCGHMCRVNRLKGELGRCGAFASSPERVRYAAATLHHGEEPILVGEGGSGAVFLSHCSLRCVYCQNYQISQNGQGKEVSYKDLAQVFLSLQRRGAESLNLVTPTNFIYPILLALREAYRAGLCLPLVYNTNGFDSVELIDLLDGIVDVYLPDMKYMDPAEAKRYSEAESYPVAAKDAIRAMYKQVGPIVTEKGIAARGLIIRHLVLPNNLAGSYDLLLWMRDEGMADAHLSLMSQYSPQHRAHEFPALRWPVRQPDYDEVVDYALQLGFENVLVQAMDSPNVYLPDFEQEEPFSPTAASGAV